MFVNTEDILQSEHKLLVDAVSGDRAESCFTSGYITGVVALAEELAAKASAALKDGDG